MPVKKPLATDKKSLREAKETEETLVSLIERCEQLIDRLNHLYRMYSTGFEKQPPREVRATLDALMVRLGRMPKAKVDSKFRYQTLSDKFSLYRARWERMLRKLEQ